MSEKGIFERYEDLLKLLKKDYSNEIKLFYVFKDWKKESYVFIVTNDDKVLTFGFNRSGVLGFGNEFETQIFSINEDLSYKQIVDFKNSMFFVIARTLNGSVYSWGHNRYGVIGNGKEDGKIYKPQLNQYLSDKQIIDICCGDWHSLALTYDGEVYAWGWNSSGQIGNGNNKNQLEPTKVTGFNDEKVIMISTGLCHSMALTESGHVFCWGNNEWGQLGINDKSNANSPLLVPLSSEILIKKIECGFYHSLLLSRDGNIYWFGDNMSEKQRFPKKLSIRTNKFNDIASHPHYHISIALSFRGNYYIWGKCGKEDIREPKEIDFKSVNDIFNHYFQITYKTWRFIKNNIDLQTLRNDKYETEFEEQVLIGCGSYSIVCKAINKIDRSYYAIKKVALNEEELKTVFKELELLSKCESDFVVKYITSWVENNYILSDSANDRNSSNKTISWSHRILDPKRDMLLHIQMEFCSKTLEDVISLLNNFETLSVINFYISSELFIELCECLNYLHKQKPPIIHRDLKPANILVTDGMNGRFVKLCDFGLAAVHEFDNQSYSSRTGSLKYMAPEVKSGRHYNTKADIYSLGIIIQELFNISDTSITNTSTFKNIFSKLNQLISKNKSLNTTYSNLFQIYKRMKSEKINSRPNCEQILSEKIYWFLSLNDTCILHDLKEQLENLDKQSFHYLFLKSKLDSHSLNFNNEIIVDLSDFVFMDESFEEIYRVKE
jgi:alpha-tubulin suppressor-like RCC1 family protein/serine/threonine protein kinase